MKEMKNIILIASFIVLTGCTTTPAPHSALPEFDNVNRLFYTKYWQSNTPTAEVSHSFHLTIWLREQPTDFMRYYCGPEIIHVFHGTNRVYMSELFDAEVPRQCVRQLYSNLCAHVLQTLPKNDTALPLYQSHGGFSVDINDHTLGPSWNFKDTLPTTGEEVLLHELLSEFIRSRISEQPDALHLRRIPLSAGEHWPPPHKGPTP